MGNPIIELNNIDVSLSGKMVLSDITWRICSGEHWAFIGCNGAGKSTLLKLIYGDLWPDQCCTGTRTYCFKEEKQSTTIGIKDNMALVSAENQNAYIRYDTFQSAESVIHTGFYGTVWLQSQPDDDQLKIADTIIRRLKLDYLRKKEFRNISQGEARKVLIARALVANPKLLLLDEFYNGLDKRAHKDLRNFIVEITEFGVQLILTTHRLTEIAEQISYALVLEDGKIVEMGKKEDVYKSKKLESIIDLPHTVEDLNIKNIDVALDDIQSYEERGDFLIKIENADVYIKEKKILSGINWHINNGENWIVLGDNGAGKSTLLKLICGDVVPAYGGAINRFGNIERSNIWEIKKKIGYVSADLQANYTMNLSGEEVVQSGFFSSIGLWEIVTDAQKRIAMEWLTFFDIEELSKKEIHTMSYGQFRKILIVRAMVNNPSILVLDEPCDGLDTYSRAAFLATLSKVSKTQTSIVLATHHIEEMLPQIHNILTLKDGMIESIDKRQQRDLAAF